MSTQWVCYDEASGEIAYTITGKTPPVVAQLVVLETNEPIRALTHYVQDGAIVAYSAEQAEAKRQRVPRSYWSNTTMSWVPRTMDISQAKEFKWETIKQARASYIDSGLVTPYGTLQTAQAERQNITDAVLLAQTLAAQNQPVSITWTLQDNSTVVFGLTEIITVGLLLGQKVQAAHAHARQLRAAIDSAATTEDLDQIDWGL